jgi:hypothetical protein
MDSKSITRKDFFMLTFTLIGSAAASSACSSSSGTNVITDGGGVGGQGGHGGAGGAGGGAAGAGGGAGGSAGDAGTATTACTNPLPETELTNTSHVHTLMVAAATLNATADQTITTGSAMDPGGPLHMHTVVLTVASLATLKAGGNVTVTSTISAGHNHDFRVSCT